MKRTPKVSVVMPAYNAELYIARAIESILNQSFQDFELIIIDDRSSDSTVKIAEKYSKLDSRIRLYLNKTNLKIARTLNKGIFLAKSDLIARMDADDISDKKRLELQYRFLNTNPNVAIVGSYMHVVDGYGNIIAKRTYPTNSDEMKKVMFRYSPFAHPAVMYRKKVVVNFGCYDYKLACEDTDLWFKLGSKYEFANIPEFLLKYTLIQTSNSYGILKKIELDGLKIKIQAIIRYHYHPSFYDFLYNIGEYSTLWIMPPKFRIWLYTKLRSAEII